MAQALVTEGAGSGEARLVAAFRDGDEHAFCALLERYHRASIRVAAAYVKQPAAAEEVAQEAWLAVLQSIAQFEGRSSFKTWVFRIVANIAKRRAQSDARTVPFSALGAPGGDDPPSVDPSRFLGASERLWAGHWAQPLARWDELPEERLTSLQTRAIIEEAIAALPDMQRQVVELRDVQECTAEEACAVLGISEANQRVLLHRARSRLRAVLEAALGETRS